MREIEITLQRPQDGKLLIKLIKKQAFCSPSLSLTDCERSQPGVVFIRDVSEKAYKQYKEESGDTNYRVQYVHQTLYLLIKPKPTHDNAAAIVADEFINAVIDIAPLLNRRSACLTATGRGSKPQDYSQS